MKQFCTYFSGWSYLKLPMILCLRSKIGYLHRISRIHLTLGMVTWNYWCWTGWNSTPSHPTFCFCPFVGTKGVAKGINEISSGAQKWEGEKWFAELSDKRECSELCTDVILSVIVIKCRALLSHYGYGIWSDFRIHWPCPFKSYFCSLEASVKRHLLSNE